MEEILLENVPIEVSNRHIHLTKEHCRVLFGYDELKYSRSLSQPGQYLAKEKLDIVSLEDDSKFISNVSIIGPTRLASQVEVMLSDTSNLGINQIEIRESGLINNTPGIKLKSQKGEVILTQGLIVAKRHLHIPESIAYEAGIKSGEILYLNINNGNILKGLVARISERFSLSVHIDVDEAIALKIPRFNSENEVNSKVKIGDNTYQICLRPSAYGTLIRK